MTRKVKHMYLPPRIYIAAKAPGFLTRAGLIVVDIKKSMKLVASPLEDKILPSVVPVATLRSPLITYLITFSPLSGSRIIPPHHEVLDINPTNHVENSEYIRTAIGPSIDVRVDETFWFFPQSPARHHLQLIRQAFPQSPWIPK